MAAGKAAVAGRLNDWSYFRTKMRWTSQREIEFHFCNQRKCRVQYQLKQMNSPWHGRRVERCDQTKKTKNIVQLQVNFFEPLGTLPNHIAQMIPL